MSQISDYWISQISDYWLNYVRNDATMDGLITLARVRENDITCDDLCSMMLRAWTFPYWHVSGWLVSELATARFMEAHRTILEWVAKASVQGTLAERMVQAKVRLVSGPRLGARGDVILLSGSSLHGGGGPTRNGDLSDCVVLA